MKVFIKLIVRRPFRSLVCFVLLLVSTVVFLANVFEYQLISQRIDESLSYYRQTGYLKVAGGDEASNMPLETEWAEQIRKSEYVSYVNQANSYRCILPDVQTCDFLFSTADSLYGVNTAYLYGRITKIGKGQSGTSYSPSQIYYEDDECNTIAIRQLPESGVEMEIQIEEVVAGSVERISTSTLFVVYMLGTEEEQEAFCEEVEIGQEYLFKVEVGGPRAYSKNEGYLCKLDGMDDWFYPVDEGERVDLTQSEFAQMQIAMERLNQEQHMFQMTASADMSTMKRMQGNTYYVQEGRKLYYSDTEEENPVCVVSRTLAKDQNLKVGDTITVELRNDVLLAYRYRLLALEDNKRWEKWESADKITLELEIVGILDSLESEYEMLYALYLYMPESLLPEEWLQQNQNAALTENSFSFVLNSPADAEAFLRENEEALGAQGCQIVLEDCGWESFAATTAEMKRGNIFGIVMFGCAMLFVQCLVLVILFRSNKKESAIMQALGVSKKRVQKQLFQSIALIGMPGILLGGLFACRYAEATVEKSLANLEIVVSNRAESISLAVMLLGIIGVLLLFVVLLILFGQLLVKKPLMEQIQESEK